MNKTNWFKLLFYVLYIAVFFIALLLFFCNETGKAVEEYTVYESSIAEQSNFKNTPQEITVTKAVIAEQPVNAVEVEQPVEAVETCGAVKAVEYYSTNELLTDEEMQVNATVIFDYLYEAGWHKDSIYAFLGNVQQESHINPGKWQNGKAGNENFGFGLVQWTPATKLFEWCDARSIYANEMFSQLDRLQWEVENKKQWCRHKGYSVSFEQFVTNSAGYSLEYLTELFFKNYEQPNDNSLGIRIRYARQWKKFFEEN